MQSMTFIVQCTDIQLEKKEKKQLTEDGCFNHVTDLKADALSAFLKTTAVAITSK